MRSDGIGRYRSRPEQQPATEEECRRRYEALFGQPWDQERMNDWREWLSRDATVDAEARDVLAKLGGALDAARRFFAEHSVPPIEQREKRQGLRVELANDGGAAVYRFFVDPETLPPEAPKELRSSVEPFPDIPAVPATELLVAGCDATVEWQPPGLASAPVTLRYRLEAPQGGSFALFLRVVARDAVEQFAAQMDRVLPLFDVRRRTPTWEAEGTLARITVLGFFDRSYSPGELIERRSGAAPPDRLTDHELAVMSILCGNWPNMPANDYGWSAAEIIDREARHMTTARETLEALRAAGFPIPRAFAASKRIDLVGDPPGDVSPA